MSSIQYEKHTYDYREYLEYMWYLHSEYVEWNEYLMGVDYDD